MRCNNEEYAKLMHEGLAYEYRYFRDMTLEAKFIKDCFTVEYLNADGTVLGPGSYGEIPYISISDWLIKEKPIKDLGRCNNKKFEITIQKDLAAKQRKLTFLHEMIHAYEFEIESCSSCDGNKLKEILLIELYKKIEKKLRKQQLNKIIRTATNALFWDDNFHSLLFVLKSIDLDIRLKQPFGSVFGYGKEDYF